MQKKWMFLMGLGVLFSMASMSVAADTDYPTRSIEVVIGAREGGGTDVLTRVLTDKAREILGKEFVIINKTGGGRVVLTPLASAKPDGYSLGAITSSWITFVPLFEKVSYDPFNYTLLLKFGTLDFGVFVLPDSPFKTMKDIIDYARANPGKFTMGVTQVNSANHVALEVLCRKENVKMTFVPFGGANPTTLALLGGHVMAASSATSGFARQTRAGQVRVLCMMSDERMDDFPDVPTLKELGYEDLVFQSHYLIVAPKNLDKAVAEKLEDTFRKAVESPQFIKVAKDISAYSKPMYMDALDKWRLDEYNTNKKHVETLGLKQIK